MKPKIGVGFRIGKLTVSDPTGERKNGYTIWNCACDCGGAIQLDTRTLQRGTVLDCGCETKVKPGQKDLTGHRFGRLVCLEPSPQRDKQGGTQWLCQCDCGKQCLAATHQLLCGYKKSCGCLSHPPVKDYVGKRFGMLTVLEYARKRDGMHRWRCRCQCGKETIVRHTNLLNGHTKSCGCLQKTILQDNLCLVDGTSVAKLKAGRDHPIASNTSGYTGVYWNKRNQKWAAQITFKGKTYYLGTYDKMEDAVKARKRGEEMHEDFLEWYYQTHPKNTSDKEAAATVSSNDDQADAILNAP